MTDYGIALLVMAAASFVPSGMCAYLVQERSSEEKQVQAVAGVARWTYWAVAFAWDFLVRTKAQVWLLYCGGPHN